MHAYTLTIAYALNTHTTDIDWHNERNKHEETEWWNKMQEIFSIYGKEDSGSKESSVYLSIRHTGRMFPGISQENWLSDKKPTSRRVDE